MTLETDVSKLSLEQVRQAYKQFFIEDYLMFIKKAFSIVNKGEILEMNWHIEYVVRILEYHLRRVALGLPREHHLIFNVPPRSLKSYLITMCAAAWVWLFNPSIKFIGSSFSGTLAVKHNMKTRRLVESDWYRSFSGIYLAKDQNQKSIFENTDGGVREATSVGGSIIGSGGNVFMLDDVQNPKMAASKPAIKGVTDYFDQEASTRLNRPEIDLFIVVMQRLGSTDLTAHLLKKNPEAWKQYSLPAEIGKGLEPKELEEKYIDGLLFPSRFTTKFLAAQKIALGSYGYAGQYGQLPAPEEGGIIERQWFVFIEPSEVPEDIAWDLWIDGAYTNVLKNDPTGLMMVGDDIANGRIIIRHAHSEWLKLPKLLTYITEYTPKHGGDLATMAYCEPKASGKDIVSMLETQINITEIKGSLVAAGKDVRANFASPFIESGRVVLVRDNWNEAYIHQMCGFPTAEHDEYIDLTGYACKKYLKNG